MAKRTKRRSLRKWLSRHSRRTGSCGALVGITYSDFATPFIQVYQSFKVNWDEAIMVMIRKAKREDCKTIRNLIQELADFERMPDGPKINSEVLEKDGFDTDHPLFICYVAEIDRNVIGYAISYYTYSTWGGKAMYLEDLYVTPSYRRERVGSELLKAVAKEAVDNSCCRLDFSVLKWNPARDFYKSKGAIDITEEEEWHHYRFTNDTLKSLAADS